MAAPTNVRVESTSPTAVVVRWVHGGANTVQVYRSTDGISYATTGDPIPTATHKFTDEGLQPDTKYWYKLSDNAGSTFSAVKTVVTQDCQDSGSTDHTEVLNLPRAKEVPLRHRGLGGKDEEGIAIEAIGGIHRDFDEAMLRIEEHVKRTKEEAASEPCPACVDSEGKIVIDCSQGCTEFDVVLPEDDVTSITYKNCKEPPTVNWQCPSNFTDCGVCGFPAGTAFFGDECTQARIPGGSTVTSGPKPPKGKPGGSNPRGGGSGGGGGGTCACTPAQGNTLTIKCCTANCSMDCSSSRSLVVKVCGGTGPYTISVTGSVSIKRASGTAVGSGTIEAGESITLAPPTNSGSAVAGTAYTKVLNYCTQTLGGGCAGAQTNGIACADFNCADANTGFTTQADNPGAQCGCTEAFENGAGCKSGDCAEPCLTGPAGGSCTVWNSPSDPSVGDLTSASACDRRTAQMVTDGCNPCGVSASGKVITVTDTLGVSVVKTINA